MDIADALNPAAAPAKATRREWLGLAVIALPCLVYSMDLTVLNLALPRIVADLKPSSATLLWIIDIYGFFVAGLLVPMGNVGDRIGRRRLLLSGAAAFCVASIVAATSRTTGILIAARAMLEDQERIFDEFERATESENLPGMGLGLWLVRRIVTAHGGAINLASVPGQGAAFSVLLPLGEQPSTVVQPLPAEG